MVSFGVKASVQLSMRSDKPMVRVEVEGKVEIRYQGGYNNIFCLGECQEWSAVK